MSHHITDAGNPQKIIHLTSIISKELLRNERLFVTKNIVRDFTQGASCDGTSNVHGLYER